MAKIRSGASTDELTIDPTSKGARVTLYDSAGHEIDAVIDAEGHYHLAVTTNQDVVIDDNNSSEDPIISGSLFQGTATSTLGINCIQVNIFANQILTLYIDQSMDGSNWDLSSLPVITSANAGLARNYIATASYYRIRVLNNSGSTATIVRIQSALLPIGDGAKDIIHQAVMVSWEEMAGTAGVESTLQSYTNATVNGVALSGATSYTVTAGRNLLITGIGVYYKSTNNTADRAIFRLRTAASGINNSSPIIWQHTLVPIGSVGTNIGYSQWVNMGEGIKILVGQQVTFTYNTSSAGCTVGLVFVGYEF